jgi:hypothetical protein
LWKSFGATVTTGATLPYRSGINSPCQRHGAGGGCSVWGLHRPDVIEAILGPSQSIGLRLQDISLLYSS